MSDADVKEIEKQVTAEVEEAVKFADESPKPVSTSCQPSQACVWPVRCSVPASITHCAVRCCWYAVSLLHRHLHWKNPWVFTMLVRWLMYHPALPCDSDVISVEVIVKYPP